MYNFEVCLEIVEKLIYNNCMKIDELKDILIENNKNLYFEEITEEKLPIVIGKFNINSRFLKDLNNIRLLIYKNRVKYPFGILGTNKNSIFEHIDIDEEEQKQKEDRMSNIFGLIGTLSYKLLYVDMYEEKHKQYVSNIDIIFEYYPDIFSIEHFTKIVNNKISKIIELNNKLDNITDIEKLSIYIVQKILLNNA